MGSNLIGVVLNKVRANESGLDYNYAYGVAPTSADGATGPRAATVVVDTTIQEIAK